MGRYCKVLIVEDELLLRQGMKHMMDWEEHGFSVIGEAANGKEAIDMIEKYQPHIIILDIVMPVMDGVELSRFVQDTYPEIQIIILSSYDKFEYVKATLCSGAVDYILKPTLNEDQLLNALYKAVQRIPHLHLEDERQTDMSGRLEKYLLGFQDEQIHQELLKYLPHTYLQILCVNVRKTCISWKEINKVTYEIDAFFKSSNIEYFLVTLNEEILFVLLNYRIGQERSVENSIYRLAETIRRTGIHTHIVLSRKFEEITQLKQIYEEELQPYAESIFYLEDQLVTQVSGERTEADAIPRFDYDQYTKEINRGQFETAVHLLKQHLILSAQRQLNEYKLKNIAKNLLYGLIVKVEEDYPEAEYLHQELLKDIDQCHYAAEFLAIMEQIEERITAIIRKGPATEDIRMQEILNYIERHYQEPLDLADLAEVFRFNYFYLSSYFNKECKEGFSGYLNRIRIQEACRLLENSEMSIAEVSSYVGYSDQSYFSRVFKKIIGDTPSTYRKSPHTKG